MIALTLAEITQAVTGTLELGDSGLASDFLIYGNSQTDSREVKPGEIFFARRGEETDGHLFVDSAVANGAVLIIAEKSVNNSVPSIIVQDTDTALNDLATKVVEIAVAKHNLQIIGITGSNGKTSTKNLTHMMVARLGETIASEKSFNNEVGGPLTALRVEEKTEYLVSEMGASAKGEIARLTKMAPPNIGVVLSVGLAHAGEFGGIDVTFATKSEMVESLNDSGVAVLNREDPRVSQMKDLTKARVKFFGLDNRSDVWAENIDVSATGTSFTLHIKEESEKVKFPVLGEHQVMNALAASTVASELGLPLQDIVEVLENTVKPAKWRMEVTRKANDITIINDAYNASPDSMQAALKTLAQVKNPEGRSVAVLGIMSELGKFSGAEHDRLGLLAVRLRIDELVVVGKEARRLFISSINEGAWSGESVFFETHAEAEKYLLETLRPKDTVLFKSSNSAGLRFLGDRVTEALA